MDDLISRSDAIGAVKEERFPIDSDYAEGFMAALDKVEWILKEWLPSAQPTEASCWGCNCQKMERLKDQKTFSEMVHLHDAETHEERTETHTCDCIERKAAIDAFYKHPNIDWTTLDVLAKINALPSAQPEHTNSWCIDCKEYDTENKCCPRYNRVIKQTLDDAYRHGETESEARFHAQQRWIPCSERLPEEGQEILATTTDNAWGDVVIIRTYYKEMHKSVIAWMPLPKPYRAERRTDERSVP